MATLRSKCVFKPLFLVNVIKRNNDYNETIIRDFYVETIIQIMDNPCQRLLRRSVEIKGFKDIKSLAVCYNGWMTIANISMCL